MATLLEVSKALSYLAALYPRFEMTKETVKAYATILEDIAYPVLQLAANEIGSRNSPWFPAAGEIRQAALDLIATDADRITAGEAWDEVCRAVGSVGSMRPAPEWSHPDIGRTVKAVGGWIYLCQSENPMTDRARFMDMFKIYRRRAETDRRMLPATREFVAQHRRLEAEGSAGLIEAEVKRLADGMAAEVPQLEAR